MMSRQRLDNLRRYGILLLLFLGMLTLSGCDTNEVLKDVINLLPYWLATIFSLFANALLKLMTFLYGVVSDHLIPLIPGAFYTDNLMNFYKVGAGISVTLIMVISVVSAQTYAYNGNNVFSPAKALFRMMIALVLLFAIPAIFKFLSYFFEYIAVTYYHVRVNDVPFDIGVLFSNLVGNITNNTTDPAIISKATFDPNHNYINDLVNAIFLIIVAAAGIFFIIKMLLLKGAQLIGLMLSFILSPFAVCGVASPYLESWLWNWLKKVIVLLLYSVVWAIGLKLLLIVPQLPMLITDAGYNKTIAFLTPFIIIGLLGLMTQVNSFADGLIEGAGNVGNAVGSGGTGSRILSYGAGRLGSELIRSKGADVGKMTGKLATGAASGAGKAAAGVGTAGISVLGLGAAKLGMGIMSTAGKGAIGSASGLASPQGRVGNYLARHAVYSGNKVSTTVNAGMRSAANIMNNMNRARRAIGATTRIPKA